MEDQGEEKEEVRVEGQGGKEGGKGAEVMEDQGGREDLATVGAQEAKAEVGRAGGSAEREGAGRPH